MPHICVSGLGQCCSSVACPAPSHHLNQYWLVNWTIRNKFKKNSNQNTKVFTHKNAVKKGIYEMSPIFPEDDELAHWGRDKMAAVFLAAFSNAFSSMKMYEFRLKFHWSLFLRVQLTISPGDKPRRQAIIWNNAGWFTDAYASLGLNESTIALITMTVVSGYHNICHQYSDVKMSAMASQTTGISIVYPTVGSSTDQRKHQSSASLAFVRGIRATGLCEGNPPVTSEFPAQRASSAENVSVWWRHRDGCCYKDVVYQCVSKITDN